MGEWQYVRIELEDRIAVFQELGEAVDQLLADDQVKAAIITGGGK